jgi:putative ABC transport system permease protein
MIADEPFGFGSLAAALALVGVALLLSWWQRLDVEKGIGLACIRAFIQLMTIGYVIHLILQTDEPLYVALTVAAMLLFAVITSARRARGLPGSWLFASASIDIAAIGTLGIIPAGARYVIPIGGMIIGNCMNVASVTAVRLLQDAADRRPQIEASLALGASPRQSTTTLARRSVQLAMVPVIDATKTTGLVCLPGAMTGMILAGADPLQAVRLQEVVMFMLLAAVALTATIMSHLAPGRLFTPQQLLRRLGM